MKDSRAVGKLLKQRRLEPATTCWGMTEVNSVNRDVSSGWQPGQIGSPDSCVCGDCMISVDRSAVDGPRECEPDSPVLKAGGARIGVDRNVGGQWRKGILRVHGRCDSGAEPCT